MLSDYHGNEKAQLPILTVLPLNPQRSPRTFRELFEKKIRFPNAEDMVGSIDIITDYYDVSDELLHENSEFKSYLKELSTTKGDFSEERIRKFSSAFEQAGV